MGSPQNKTNKRVLAIDPGTMCGWALYNNGEILSGVWNLKPSRADGGGMRYVRLMNRLQEVGPVDQVVYEEVHRHMGTIAAHIYGGIVSHIQRWCEENWKRLSLRSTIPYAGVPLGTIKKHATGKGNASKDMMVAAFEKATGTKPKDDNEADAWWLLDYAMEHLVPD